MHINHIAINCKDLDAVASFFTTYFHAKETQRYHNPKTGLHSRMLDFEDGARLELMNWPDMEVHRQTPHIQGLVHISVSVGSKEKVDALTKRLAVDGYECSSRPRTTGDGYYESSINGPEGIIIEITV